MTPRAGEPGGGGWGPRFRRALELPRGTRRVAEEVDDEVRFHLESRERELVAQGLAPEAARAEARRQFGDVGRVAAELREISGHVARTRQRSETLASLWQDVRYAVRTLRRAPAFAAAALLTLALGIGATTTVFSVVYGVLFRPLPYAAPERLVQLWETSTQTGDERNPVSVPHYRDWVAGTRSFSTTAAYAYNRFTLAAAGTGTPEQVQGLQLWGDVATLLGARPLIGRTIQRQDARDYVAVLSEGLWRRRFGADPNVVGSAVRMNGRPYTVVGVMPASFTFPRSDVELWASYATILSDSTWSEQRGRRFQRVVARLAPGVTPAAAQRELVALMKQLAVRYPDSDAEGGAAVVPLHEQIVGDARRALLVLFGAVGCVLLIACVNVAHLLLARGASRERELAVRAALGAGGVRVARQLLTEALVLATAGGAAGVALAFAGVKALVRLAPESVPRLDAVRVDGWTLAFTAAAVLVTGALVGLAPAIRVARRRDLAAAVRDGGRGSGVGLGQRALQGSLVTAEVALSLALLVGAGLLLRSFDRLRRVDPGVEPAGVASMLVIGSVAKYPDPERQSALFADVTSRVAALPGVSAVGICDCLPPDMSRQSGSTFVEGHDRNGKDAPISEQNRADGGYFAALRIPVLAGRVFTDADRAGALPVAVVNETFARRLLADGGAPSSAVGRRVSLDDEHWMTVVGVVADVHYAGLAAPVNPTMYSAFAQDPFPGMNLFTRTAGGGDPLAIVPAIRRALLAIDGELPVSRVATLEEGVVASTAGARFNVLLLVAFAGAAFALAAVGVYGVVAYGVVRRRHELGVRVALGARPAQVVRLVLAQSLRPVMLGAALGLAVAAAAAHVLEHMLYATSVHDPVAYAAGGTLLLAVAAVAAYVPGRRAAGADPVEALRGE